MLYAFLKSLVLLPLPILGLAVAAWLARGGRAGRILSGLVALALWLALTPAVGYVFEGWLARQVPEAGPATPPLAAIVVPTGGVFEDPVGGWWPNELTVSRIAEALAHRQEVDGPLIVSGGDPSAERDIRAGGGEADIALRRLGLAGRPGIVADVEPSDSARTARSVARRLGASAEHPIPVLLVTSCPHYARMGMYLRSAGLPPWRPRGGCRREWVAGDFLPQPWGLEATGYSWYELLGLAWGLVRPLADRS